MEISDLLKDPNKIGAVFLLALAVTAFIREWIVPGTTYVRAIAAREAYIVELKRERDEFKSIAMRGVELSERALGVASNSKSTLTPGG